MTSVHDEETGERDRFKDEFKRFKKKSTDMREVLDLRDENFKARSEKAHQSSCSPAEDSKAEELGLRSPSDWQVLSLPELPGLLLLPDLFQPGGQHRWVKRCLVDYPCKPNICNLDAHIQRTGRGCLWPPKCSDSDDSIPSTHQAKKPRLSEEEGISRETPLYRLRWVTLGYHYNWDTKEYSSERCSPFPPDLSALSSFILHHAGFPGFNPEAAIVNYYHLDSSLSGHTDHSEKDLTQPLLSISFGRSAIFLIGGKTKQVRPTAMLLRSGDVVIMSREARLAYHGVPRILSPQMEEEAVEGPRPASEATIVCDCSVDVRGCTCGSDGDDEGARGTCTRCHELTLSYLSTSRININVRQVISEEFQFA